MSRLFAETGQVHETFTSTDSFHWNQLEHVDTRTGRKKMMFRFTDFSLQLNYEIYFNYIMKSLFHA